jgi:hypothetical protein
MQNEIKVSYYLTDDDIEDIVITALEGGIGYWACLDNSDVEEEWWCKQPADMPTAEYAYKILCDGGTLHFLEEEGDDEWYMDMADLFKGIGLAIQNQDWDGDMDMLDAMVADTIFQYAMLGSVVYG